MAAVILVLAILFALWSSSVRGFGRFTPARFPIVATPVVPPVMLLAPQIVRSDRG